MAIVDPFKEHIYQPVHHEDSDLESPTSSEFIEHKPHRKSYISLVWPWIASTITFALISAYLLFQQQINGWSTCVTASPAFRTDFKDSHPYISYEERVYTGRFWYNETIGKVYRDVDPSEPQYFGLPSPEIDAAWDDLLRGEFVDMTEEEAAPFDADLNTDPTKHHYHMEPDMFHSLHCLNAIRMKLDSDYYSQHMGHHQTFNQRIQESPHFPDDWSRIHMDHCLDQLRQSIQCQGDMSPVPLYFFGGDHIGLGVGQTHTCRKWGPMRKWMDVRKERDDERGGKEVHTNDDQHSHEMHS
ncbi:hypothetical protein PENANT_c003G08188 [Penicillium antarcticum]|uniref:Uncharacterized protein n=1 Tax=Penicillium antarcticum TaxID=416450 RepID=A0A1V6QHI9_9EURO|nr:uncharacterized protein N7508_005810 [Penicillium antarcticum]KAJ5306795.1 hypothetical protein N7508_005810 [Penicillium antarcticum]OQD88691.1 hypothetical protein PENANT_c003G08188 [Penicillium antarcticum]